MEITSLLTVEGDKMTCK